MKNILFGLILFLSFAACRVKPQANAITEQEIREFVKHYDDLWARRDTTGMKTAVDEDYIYFTSTGSELKREDIVSWFTPVNKYNVANVERSEVNVHLTDNIAVVSSRWIGNGNFDGKPFNDDQRCSLVIIKTDGQLKLVSEHCTQITGK